MGGKDVAVKVKATCTGEFCLSFLKVSVSISIGASEEEEETSLKFEGDVSWPVSEMACERASKISSGIASEIALEIVSEIPCTGKLSEISSKISWGSVSRVALLLLGPEIEGSLDCNGKASVYT